MIIIYLQVTDRPSCDRFDVNIDFKQCTDGYAATNPL